jgi:hypothetical protein
MVLTNTIPAVNFGIELEVSCASGNLRQWIALALQDHTRMKVGIQMHIGNDEKVAKV